jgi:RNA polymerase sigma-70 factor (ECF subfamily)
VPESRHGSEDQLVRLMNDYERPIFNFLLTIVRDPDVALDCTQDTFLRAYEHLNKGREIKAAWLYTVARNRAMDEFRRKRRTETDIEALEQVPVEEQPVEDRLAVEAAIAQLSEGDREVLYLFDVAGFKTDEIGKMLGVRGSAIRQRLSRARTRFRVAYGVQP